MGGEICYRKGSERGPWYEVQCVKRDIISKESRNEDASFERSLLRAWGKIKGWGSALQAPPRTRKKSHQTRVMASRDG